MRNATHSEWTDEDAPSQALPSTSQPIARIISAMGYKAVYEDFYRKAKQTPEKLPWHREERPELLERAVGEKRSRGNALDIGCGTGVFASWLAEQGFEVTAVDFIPEALDMARTRAAKQGVKVDFVHADVLEW